MSRRPLRASLAAVLLLAALVLTPFVPGAVPRAAAAPDLTHDGRSAATAAGSCWEIKQHDPDAEDGAYWLLTPAMEAPARFYCDQTTDGGGWVLIGSGRDGWDRYEAGQGSLDDLLDGGRTTADFRAVQLPTATVDALLNAKPVSDLQDGLRVVRAANPEGTAWQDLRVSPGGMGSWEWSLDSYRSYKATSATYDTTEGDLAPGLLTTSWWGGTQIRSQASVINTAIRKNDGYRLGYGYSNDIAGGSTSATSYWRSANGVAPLPFTEIYLRPQVTSDDPGFTPVPDGGTPAVIASRTVQERASATSWGVTGTLNGRTSEGNALVQAFAQVGSTIFVAGNFSQVTSSSGGKATEHHGVAAFNATTGEPVEGFNLDLDNQAKALLVLPDGRLLVGGDFTTANGQSHVGTVAVDPATGQVDPSWDLRIDNRLTGGVVTVRSLTLGADGLVYVAGQFTHLSGAGASNVYARAAGRVSQAGKPDRSWNPELNGGVVDADVSADGTTFYAAGYFTRSQTQTQKKAASISTQPGAALSPAFTFVPSETEDASYQQAVTSVGSRVFFGGAQHSLFGYEASSMTRTSSSVMLSNGGDVQTTVSDGHVLYAGCHCSDFAYEGASTVYPINAYTHVAKIQWMGAWDAATGALLRWTPDHLGSASSAGAWASFIADDGALWLGGDFNKSVTTSGRTQWNSGFVRYPDSDRVAPDTPTGLRFTDSGADEVTLAWDAVGDATGYEVLRDDRVVASTTSTSASVPRTATDRFAVRAVDAGGNRSASTPVKVAPEPGATDPDNPVLLDAGASWDYLYGDSPEDGWDAAAAELTGWSQGPSPLGYGGTGLATTLSTAGARSVSAYFRTTFDVGSLDQVSGGVDLTYVADDGVVIEVNGVEVSRTRMPDGDPTSETRASAAISASAAAAAPVTMHVPAELLREGVNVIAAQTHLNYRSSPSLTFSATVVRSESPAPEPTPEPETPSDAAVPVTTATTGAEPAAAEPSPLTTPEPSQEDAP